MPPPPGAGTSAKRRNEKTKVSKSIIQSWRQRRRGTSQVNSDGNFSRAEKPPCSTVVAALHEGGFLCEFDVFIGVWIVHQFIWLRWHNFEKAFEFSTEKLTIRERPIGDV